MKVCESREGALLRRRYHVSSTSFPLKHSSIQPLSHAPPPLPHVVEITRAPPVQGTPNVLDTGLHRGLTSTDLP